MNVNIDEYAYLYKHMHIYYYAYIYIYIFYDLLKRRFLCYSSQSSYYSQGK